MAEQGVHFGEWLREEIAARKFSVSRFAEIAEVDRTRLLAWLKEPAPRMYDYSLAKLAAALDKHPSELRAMLDRAKVAKIQEERPELKKKWEDQIASIPKGKRLDVSEMLELGLPVGEGEDDFDANVEPYSEERVPHIPFFDLPLAAGEWMEVPELCEISGVGVEHGLFRVRLRGDSMKPEYPEGMVVEFRCVRADHDGPVEGKDYYVQRCDGMATFKRFVSMDEDSFTFRAVNKRKYPKPIVVARQEVTRLAKAVFRGMPIE